MPAPLAAPAYATPGSQGYIPSVTNQPGGTPAPTTQTFGPTNNPLQGPGTSTPTYAPAPTGSGSPVTSMSSANTQTVVDNNTQTMQNISGSPIGNQVDVSGVTRYSDGNYAAAPSDAVQQLDADGHPTGLWTSGGKNYATGPSAGDDPYLKMANDQIEQMKSTARADFLSTIGIIQKQYGDLIATQKDINMRGEAGMRSNLYNLGVSRYGGSSDIGQMQSLESYGLTKVQGFIDEEAKAVAAAQSAYDTGNMKLVDEQIGLAQKAADNQQTAAKAVIDKIQKANDDAKALKQKQDDELKTQKNNILLDLAKSGAPKSITDAVGKSGSMADAIAAAGQYLQSSTNPDLQKYLQYKRDAETKGLTPNDYQSWQDAQDKKAQQAKINEAYATQAAKDKADADSGSSTKVQQKLEQEGRQVLMKEFSSRTGALGIENIKVNLSNHLNSIVMQYYDSKTGNYNIPVAQYNELAIGLANLVSQGGVATDTVLGEINKATAAGDLKSALQYATGAPQTGNTQAMIKNAIDSIDRQASTSIRNRQAALENMKDMLPTDLEQSRKDALIKATKMVGYEGQDRISKTAVNTYVKTHPTEAQNIAKLYQVPGATDSDIEEYLRAQGKIQ